jgi:hypothetical protein
MDRPEAAHLHAQFEAMLLRPVLKPLSEAFGEYGDIVADEFARVLAKALRP